MKTRYIVYKVPKVTKRISRRRGAVHVLRDIVRDMTQDFDATQNARPGVQEDTYNELPNPQEISHISMEPQLEKLLLKSIALQLKPMNNDTQISRSAFQLLSLLAMDQMDSMVYELHRLPTAQRRQQVAKGDMELFLRGFNISTSDLDLKLQESNTIRKRFSKDSGNIDIESKEFSDTIERFNLNGRFHDTPFQLFEQQEQDSSILFPPSNKLQQFIPNWLPSFPPDHTYKFTPQYNKLITDEAQIRIKSVEEGKQSEKSLLNLINNLQDTKDEHQFLSFTSQSAEEDELADKESFALYHRIRSRKNDARKKFLPLGSLVHIPKKFNVEEYAHKRIDIARNKVTEYEMMQIKKSENPFLKLTKLIVLNKEDKNKFQINKDIRVALRRSFNRMINKIPELEEQKKITIKEAKEEREKKLEELKQFREKRERESKSETATSAHLETILFDTNVSSNISNNNHGVDEEDLALFGTLGSSDDEVDLSLDKNENKVDNSMLPQETTIPSFDITKTTVSERSGEYQEIVGESIASVEESTQKDIPGSDDIDADEKNDNDVSATASPSEGQETPVPDDTSAPLESQST